jgi:hypothetical protein
MAALYNVSDLVLYKDDKDGTGIFIARIIKKRADYGGEHRYLIQTINKSGTGREWNTELKDYVNEDSLHISGDVFTSAVAAMDADLPTTDPHKGTDDILEHVVNYFWNQFPYVGDNAKASKFIIKYILPSLGNWSPPGSPPAIEEHTKPHHPNTGISWGHNDDNTLYRLHIPGYALWKKKNSS